MFNNANVHYNKLAKGASFPDKDNLIGAWLHRKAPQETTILDERPNVDYSRTWYKARALQFTGTEYIDVPYQLDLTQKYKFTYEFICTEYNNWEPIIDSRAQPSDRSFSTYIRPDRTVTVNTQYGQLNFDPLITDCRYLVTIEHNGSEITATFENTTLGTSQTLSNSTLAYTPDTAETFFRIGGAPYGTGGLRQRLGYFKYERDGITLIEYAFEEGEGSICYNRVMNNFHGTINNATISTFRVEDVRITNNDQGTFLNTEGYRDNNKIYSSTDYPTAWQTVGGAIIEQGLSFQGKEGVKKVTFPAGTYSNALLQAFHNNAIASLRTTTGDADHSLTYYFPSGQQNNWFRLPSTATSFQAVEDTWATVSFNISTSDARVFMIDGDGDSNLDITLTEDVVIYIGDYVVTEPNVYVPRPRVTDIPLYNAGKYGYYIPDDANNSIDLNTAFAGLTNDGDWMEFGIATVGTGKPYSESAAWAISIDGSDNSSFYARIEDTDFRIFGPANSYRMQANVNLTNYNFYSFRITKVYNTTNTVSTSPMPGLLEAFDRDGNLILSSDLQSVNGNEGTYTFDRFFTQTYGTDFILAYLKLSNGTVWNGANDFNGGVSITNSGTGNVTKIFFESVNEDVLGNPLTYNKPVAINLQLVNSNCAFYHQSGCDLTFSGFTVQDFTMVLYADLDSALKVYTDFRALYGTTSSDIYYMQSDEVYFRANGQTTITTPWSGGSFSNEDFTGWKLFVITRDFASGTITLHVNGVSKSVLESASKGVDYTINSIGDSNNKFLAAKVAYSACYNRVLTQDEIDNWNPFNAPQTGLEVFHIHNAGTGAVVYDVSGNNRHANVNGAILSTFWGSKQDQFHWNLKKGFLKGFGTNNNAYYNLDQPLEDPIGKTVKFGFVYNTGSGRQWLFTTNVSDVGGFYVQHNTNGNIQIEQQGTNTVILISGSNFTDGHYYEVEFDYPATSDLQTVSTVLVNGDSVSFTTGANIYGSSGNHIGYNSSGGFPLTDTRIVFIKIGNTLYSELNNWGGATLVNSGSAEYLRVPDLATENVAFAAGKWHNDAETEINFPHTAELQVINELFDYKPFFYKNAQLNDATAAYSMRKVIADYEGPLLNVIRSSDLQAQDFYPDSRGDLDTTAITNFVNGATPVLDDYSGAEAAYSLRKLRAAYSGAAVRVRKEVSLVSEEIDIGFDANGNLDTTALLSFASNADGGNVYVSIWYDQTQNDPLNQNNATQSLAASQPKIVSAGTLVEENGKAALDFDGVDDFLGRVFSLDVTLGYANFYVCNVTSDATKYILASVKNSTNRYAIGINDAGNFQSTKRTGGIVADAATYSSGQVLLSDNSTPEIYLDGSLGVGSAATLNNAFAGEFLAIGKNSAVASTGQEILGSLQEIILYNSDQSANRTGIEGNIGRYYNIDGFADGRVATWYDQANANHATQATPDKQPLIVNNGVLVTENSKPAIEFDGGTTYNSLEKQFTSALSQSVTIFGVMKNNDGDKDHFYDGYSNRFSFGYDSTNLTINAGSNISAGAYPTGSKLISNLYNTTSSQLNINGVTESTGNVGTNTMDGIVIGTLRTSLSTSVRNEWSLNGNFQELIIFASDQSSNRQDIEKNIADYYNITLSGNAGVESWVKNVSFADMYRIWYDYEYLHRLFANFEIPNKVFKILAYTSELTADQRQKVYNYLQKNYHPIYTPYSTRVLVDGGILAAGQTNTLTIIDSI